MKELHIDIETYSSENLQKSGVYRYCESGDFEVLLFGYSEDGGEVSVVDLASGESIPERVLAALTDPNVVKWAFNSSFERVCLSRFLGFPTGSYLDPSQWHCSLVWSAYLGLPLSLDGVGKVLDLGEQKMKEGKDLIRYFCVPCNPTKANGGRTRNLPGDAPEKWQIFKSYNRRDVEVELSIQRRLSGFPVPDSVWKEHSLSEDINDRGILVDRRVVEEAIRIDGLTHGKLITEIQNLTDLENPNSVVQMKGWLSEKGLEIDGLGKKQVVALLKDAEGDLERVLALRLQLAKSSVKKYSAMMNSMCVDGRVRGMFQFYGANRTGRYAGRIVQLQNLPQNHIADLDNARALLSDCNSEALEMLYGDVPDVLSQLVRTAFIPRPGCSFLVADFAAIEARVIAWLAGEVWRMDVFQEGKDLYCASASRMFKVPVEKNGVNGHLRQKGKIAELALGYGGSVGALEAMGALDMGLSESELKPLVDDWREASPRIVDLWWDVDDTVKRVIRSSETEYCHGIGFEYRKKVLFIILPSGRRLSYIKPRLDYNRYGTLSVIYKGVGTNRRWEDIESYGPKFVENIVQAIARDLLLNAMSNLKDLPIVAHVHDEVIIENDGSITLDEICDRMARLPSWATGLILRADGYECPYYQKQ